MLFSGVMFIIGIFSLVSMTLSMLHNNINFMGRLAFLAGLLVFIILWPICLIAYLKKKDIKIFKISFVFTYLFVALVNIGLTGPFYSIVFLFFLISIFLFLLIDIEEKFKKYFLILSGMIFSILIFLQIIGVIKINPEEVDISFIGGVITLIFFGILFYIIYLMNSITNANAEEYYNEILDKMKEQEERLKLKIDMHKQDLSSWHTVDKGILNNLDRIVDEKQKLISYVNEKYAESKFDNTKKISSKFDSYIDNLYTLIRHSIKITEKNDENILLTINSQKFFELTYSQFKTRFNLCITNNDPDYEIRIKLDEVKNVIEDLMKNMEMIIPEEDKEPVFKFYFTDPTIEKEKNHYVLNCMIKNGAIYTDKIKKMFSEKNDFSRDLKKYNYKTKIEKIDKPDLLIALRLPREIENVSGTFNTDYKLKLSGNSRIGGVIVITKENTEFSVELTKTEYELINSLMRKLRSDIINNNYNSSLFGYIEKSKLIKKVFGNLSKHGNRLSTHLYRLRTKLKNYGLNPELFQSKNKCLRLSTSAELKDIINE